MTINAITNHGRKSLTLDEKVKGISVGGILAGTVIGTYGVLANSPLVEGFGLGVLSLSFVCGVEVYREQIADTVEKYFGGK